MPSPPAADQLGDGGARARGLAETHIDRQAEKRRQRRPRHDVEIQRIAVRVGVLRLLLRRLDGGPVVRDRGHETGDRLGQAGAGLVWREDRRRIGRRWRRDPGRAGHQRRDGFRPLGAEEVVGVARAVRHGQTAVDRERDLARRLDAGIAVAVGLRVVVGDEDEVGRRKARPQRLGDGHQVARVHRRDDHMAGRHVQARAGGPALADQDGAGGLRERPRLCAHHREMTLLRAAGEEALGPVGRDGLETVDPAVDVLQRHDEPAARVHAQGERRCLLGDQIGMVLRGGTGAGPRSGRRARQPRPPGLARARHRHRGCSRERRSGRCRWRLARIVCGRCAWCRSLTSRPVAAPPCRYDRRSSRSRPRAPCRGRGRRDPRTSRPGLPRGRTTSPPARRR